MVCRHHLKLRHIVTSFLEVLQEHKSTTNPQALEIMDFILQDLEKIDQFAHNFELMTHGETKQHQKRWDPYDLMFRRRRMSDDDFLKQFTL